MSLLVGDVVRIDDRLARVVAGPYTCFGATGRIYEGVDVEALDNGEPGAFDVAKLTLVRAVEASR
jgi:hypothetical protein